MVFDDLTATERRVIIAALRTAPTKRDGGLVDADDAAALVGRIEEAAFHDAIMADVGKIVGSLDRETTTMLTDMLGELVSMSDSLAMALGVFVAREELIGGNSDVVAHGRAALLAWLDARGTIEAAVAAVKDPDAR